MLFEIEYEICAFIFILILTIYFAMQKRLPTSSNKIFMLLLITLLIVTSSNIIGAVMMWYKEKFSYLEHYIINIIFYLSQSLGITLFYNYCIVETKTNKPKNRGIILLTMIPLVLFSIMAILTPLTKCLFYFDENKNYCYGKYCFLSFSMGIVYISLIFLLIIIRKKQISKKVFYSIMIFVFISISLQIIQIFYRNYLLTSLGNTMGILIFFLMVQSPRNYIDNTTELFNGNALDDYLNFCINNNKNQFSILDFSIDDLPSISTSFGINTSAQYLINLTDYLKKRFPNAYIFRYLSTQFIVILNNETINEKKIKDIYRQLPSSWEINDNIIFSYLTLIGVNSDQLLKVKVYSHLFDYFIKQTKTQSQGSTLLIDEESINTFTTSEKINSSILKAIREKKVEVHYQPIYSIDDYKIASLEALARIKDEDDNYIPPSLFIKIAEENGLIAKLSSLVLENVCRFLSENDITELGISRISINLSAVQFMQADLLTNIRYRLNKYNIDPNLIGLEITESVATSSIIDINDSMNNLIKDGFVFYLDDYGSGYSNLDYITSLPFKYIKIDKSLVSNYKTNNIMKMFLDNIIKILNKTNRIVVVEGVETEEQITILKNLGVKYVQGYYFSKPLNEIDTIRLINKQNN